MEKNRKCDVPGFVFVTPTSVHWRGPSGFTHSELSRLQNDSVQTDIVSVLLVEKQKVQATVLL